MEILECFEKSPRLKNKKIELSYEEFYIKKLYEIIENELNLLKQKIKNNRNDMDNLYNKKDFETREILSSILSKIDESILNKSFSFFITYENFEIFDYFINNRIVSLNSLRKKWGRSLNNEIEKEYNIAIRIQESYKDEYNTIINKLYPKRSIINEKLKNYIIESRYCNYLIEDETVFNLHISMREKENILNILNNFLLYIDDGFLENIVDHSFDCDDLNIVISKEEILSTIRLIIKPLEKDINNGSIIKINIKDYFILKYLIKHFDDIQS